MSISVKSAFIIIFSAFVSTCSNPDSYYLAGSPETRERVGEMLALLDRDDILPENRFSLLNSIGSDLMNQKKYGPLVNLLTIAVERRPNDLYNAWYLFMVAYVYRLREEDMIASIYFERILKNYPDLKVKGESLHLASLKELIRIVKRPEQVIDYYLELLARFPNRIDMGQTLFLLGKAYEQLGEWDLAIQTYTRFLPFLNVSVPGFPEAHQYARKLVDFSNSAKDWTSKSLDGLVDIIRKAIMANDTAVLKRYRAKVNFFTVSWAQGESESANAAEFEIGDFLTPEVRCAAKLDPSSNATQAFLKTSGWSERVQIWYFYFRKIYFPADPEIHGRWEWAGIYYGEKNQ